MAEACLEAGDPVNIHSTEGTIWNRKKIARWVVGFVFSAILLYLAFRGTDATDIVQSLRKTNLVQAMA